MQVAGSTKWVLFIGLSIIWGSSFILMKGGMLSLSAWQVASLRIFASGLVLLPVALRSYKGIPKNTLLYVFLSGLLGSLLPAYLFCIAEERIDSGLAGVLNSLTPVFVILVGLLFFGQRIPQIKLVGVCIALLGSVLLFFSKNKLGTQLDVGYGLLIVVATISYGLNVNMVHAKLKGLPPLQIVAIAMVTNAIPALVVLIYTHFFSVDFSSTLVWRSIGYSVVLGIAGTALASYLFYRLLNYAGPVFASMVTYGIPFVALAWGLIYGEKIGWQQVGCLLIILAGVYTANRIKLN